MKKGILVAKRKTQDKENKDVIWLTIYECPRYYTDKKSGQKKLFYNKKENSILVACISKEQNPVNFISRHFLINKVGYQYPGNKTG